MISSTYFHVFQQKTGETYYTHTHRYTQCGRMLTTVKCKLTVHFLTLQYV